MRRLCKISDAEKGVLNVKNSKIEWTDSTWNPLVGCSKVSPGCDNCYALDMIQRFKGRPGWPIDDKVAFFENRLSQPINWKAGKTIFVCSMSDLFHEDVPEQFIWQVMKAVLAAPQHKYLVLTKRAGRMAVIMSKIGHAPIKNLGLGVTVCNQEEAAKKIQLLLQTPAAMRFVSVEPMLGPIELCIPRGCRGCNHPGNVIPRSMCTQCGGTGQEPSIDWVICGGESGKRARPVHPDWIRSLRDQCVEANVPFFFKQWGEWEPWEEIREVVIGGFSFGTEFQTGKGKKIGGVPYRCKNHEWENGVDMWCVGKKAANRELDGRVWDQRPEWFFKEGSEG